MISDHSLLVTEIAKCVYIETVRSLCLFEAVVLIHKSELIIRRIIYTEELKAFT